jgi:transcriptional antiterminator NusG
MMKWYVMNVFNGKEKSVKENIERELENIKMTKYVNQLLIPKEKYFQVRNGKKIKAERSYMPGYMLIECEMNGELLGVIKNVKGVISFLGNGKNPIPMTDKEINRILKKVDDLETKDTVYDHNLVIGQSVQIVDGPFSSMVGTITDIIEEKNKVMVDVNNGNKNRKCEYTIV